MWDKSLTQEVQSIEVIQADGLLSGPWSYVHISGYCNDLRYHELRVQGIL